MLIRLEKTKHHEVKESPLIVLYQQVRRALDECWERAEPGAPSVVTRYRQTNVNLRTQQTRFAKRAGVTVADELFHNLRSLFATELANKYPAHIVVAWAGYPAAAAQKHNWPIRDVDCPRMATRLVCGESRDAVEREGSFTRL